MQQCASSISQSLDLQMRWSSSMQLIANSINQWLMVNLDKNLDEKNLILLNY